MDLPQRIADTEALEELMSRPTPALAEALARAPGDLMVLGVGGKMGPTLARMAKRADPQRRVIGVARFSEPGLQQRLEGWGVECIAADLLSREALARLPDAANVVFIARRKFGPPGREWLTWARKPHVPALVAERPGAAPAVPAASVAAVPPKAAPEAAGAIAGRWAATLECGPYLAEASRVTDPRPFTSPCKTPDAADRASRWPSRRNGKSSRRFLPWT